MLNTGRTAVLTLISLVVPFAYAGTDDTATSDTPVKVIAPKVLSVTTPAGKTQLPLYISLNAAPVDLSQPQPSITRALIVFHGKLRNADVYDKSGLEAVKTAGAEGKTTLLITPQFLEQMDVNAFHLGATVLRWAPEAWMSGANALNAPVSSFDAMDAILGELANRATFPNLKTVVLAGHSGGAQVVQRYAVVGRGGDTLTKVGIHVRYVIANPSSYVYFSPERPVLAPHGEFTFATPVKSCNGHYDLWKYGVNAPPPYVGAESFTALEQRYVLRDVRYLLGTADVDPNHPALDKTCSGEDEGPFRFFRGKAYFRYVELRHPELAQPAASQQLWFVPGVEHDGDKMLNSTCGLAALFDIGTCKTQVTDPRP